MEQKHSPLPWKSGMDIGATIKTQSVNKLIFSSNELAILARCKGEDDAQFIVQACNNFEELLETLRGCKQTLETLSGKGFINVEFALQCVKATIAKAKGR